VEDSARGTAVDDAFDFSGLQAKIMKSIEQLSHQLSQLRAGGRFNPEKLEELKIQFKDSDGNKRTARLGELAQVSAKGRNVSIAVHEADVSCSFMQELYLEVVANSTRHST
jgi:ribosome recycling factor